MLPHLMNTRSSKQEAGEKHTAGKRSFWQGLFCLALPIFMLGCSPWYLVGLEPEYPRARSFWGWGPPQVESLQPTLRWKAFNQLWDRRTDGEGVARLISDVTYDLRIWQELPPGRSCRICAMGIIYLHEPIYIKEGLSSPLHQMDVPLKPSTKYAWSVRARFQLDGHPRVTPWGGPTWVGRTHVFYHQFTTPSE